MKRFTLSTVGVAFVALLCATAGFAQPAKHTAQPAKHTGTSAAAKLPALPANIKARGRWNIGVKCDVPPFGYTDVRGNNAGFDVEIARQFARYAFGRATSVNFLCAPTASREPLLTTDRADLVISTFTYTADREARIDFSRAYYKATGRLLVKNDGAVQKLADIAGKKVATTSGSVYDRWMKNCFKDTQVVVADTFTNAMLAFQQGRADAVMYDDAVLLPVAAADRNAKLTDDAFLEAPFGIGIKQGNKALKAWVDSRLNLMRTKDQFLPILKANIAARFLSSFSKNVLRPSNTFSYAAPGAPSVETVCP
jgi:polar amino acid transport system substrate-binding protein